MSTTNTNLVPPKALESSQTAQYTSTGVKTIIDKATITNITSLVQTVSINLVISGGSPGSTNRVVNEARIYPNETYLCPELIGHVLNSGMYLSTLASAASSLVFMLSGRTIS